jgi:molybdenum cofactor synthesis domain-containing protein
MILLPNPRELLNGNEMVTGGFRELISLKETLEIIKHNTKIMPKEEIPLENAIGRVVAEDVISPIDVPHFRKSAMDGFAVRAEDTFRVESFRGEKLKIVEKEEITQGECVKITTGEPIPRGGDAVMMVEYTETIGEEIVIYKRVAPGENVIEVGTDVKKGEKLITEGELLTPFLTGIAAGVGLKKIKVRKKPTVGIISTGNEIIDQNQKLEIGKVYNINSRVLCDLFKKYETIPKEMGIVGDEWEELKRKIKTCIEGVDLLVLSGGSSVGEDDILFKVVKELGEVLVHGIRIKPGKPTLIGKIGEKLLIGLPGYPASAVANFYLIIIPLLSYLLGVEFSFPIIPAKLKKKITSTVGRYEFLTVKLTKTSTSYYAEPMWKGSSAITNFKESDGFIEIKEEIELINKEETVEVKLFV